MGKYNCEYHGKTGMIMVCSHISKDIVNKTKPDKIIRAKYIDEDFEDEFNVQLTLIYCPICIVEHNFPSADSQITEAEYDDMYKKEFKSNCIQCFRDIMEKP